jgi:hypothetical protein
MEIFGSFISVISQSPRGSFATDMDPFCFAYTTLPDTSEYDGYGEDSESYSVSLLAYAAQRGAVKIVRHLLLNHATVTSNEVYAGILGGCPEVIRMFDDHGPIFDTGTDFIREAHSTTLPTWQLTIFWS